ncbi:unnamed protein product [Brassica rapa]|uniref:Uncharacterized protein n=1 Tax=Brassica campestris TaxID=3711 RepID=A0A8D9M9L7_BRACM|nr:unnamed protein product [Brassica rapa]
MDACRKSRAISIFTDFEIVAGKLTGTPPEQTGTGDTRLEQPANMKARDQ